jgi:hypothetical protein
MKRNLKVMKSQKAMKSPKEKARKSLKERAMRNLKVKVMRSQKKKVKQKKKKVLKQKQKMKKPKRKIHRHVKTLSFSNSISNYIIDMFDFFNLNT